MEEQQQKKSKQLLSEYSGKFEFVMYVKDKNKLRAAIAYRIGDEASYRINKVSE